MSASFMKEECGANLTQGISGGNIVNVKKEVEINDEPLEGVMVAVGVKKEFDEEKGEDIDKDIEMKQEIKDVKDVEIKQEIKDVKDVEMKQEIKDVKDIEMKQEIKDEKDVKIKDEPLEDMMVGVKKEIVEKDEVMVTENELNMEPEQREDEDEGTSDSNESEPEEREYVTAIRNILGLVESPGTFACGGVLEKAKLQLSVKGVGKLNLPLSYKQGEVLKSKCKAAPFCRGSDTLVNKSVRDAWQVDAKDVTLNKEFKKLVKQKMSEIIPTLMGESFTEIQQVELELYKLVYYKKGGHFIAHRDTEKAPGMFGTLVIQLPCGHEGGALVIRHKAETKVFDFEADSWKKFFFTAFFADCEHELRKITDGHRLVLIYNLVHNHSHSPLHANNDDTVKPSDNQNFKVIMKNSIEEWKSDKKGPQYLALKLDHLYTNTNISFRKLKGKDKNIADALCSCADIEVYLATITKNEKRFGYEDDPDTDGGMPELVSENEVDTECSYVLHNWIGVNNEKATFKELELHTNEMLLKEKYMFEKYEERCYSNYQYTGNEGCNINYFYKKKAFVFWPKSHRIVISCDTNFNSVLVNCKKLSEGKKDAALEMLKGILLYTEKKHDRAMNHLNNDDKVASIFDIMILFGDTIKCLASSFLLTLTKPYESEYSWESQKKVGLPNRNSAVSLANLINKLSWESLGTSVLQLVKECAVSHTESCAQLVSSLLSLGLKEQAINVVEVVAPQIIAQSSDLSGVGGGAWAIVLASYHIFNTCFDDFVKEISKVRDYVLIKIITTMLTSLEPKVLNHCRMKKCFQNLFGILQDNGWKNLDVDSVTLIWPVVLLVDNFDSGDSLLIKFVQSIIEHKKSSNFLEVLLKCPNVVEAKDNQSVQLMVQKRLQQLDVPYPVFSWAQPDAKLISFTYFAGPDDEEINNFLRSDEETKTFGGNFLNKVDANEFGREYFQNGEYNKFGKYSARYELSGKSSNVKCKLIKTNGVFDTQVRKYNLMQEEAKVLKKAFCEPKSTGSLKSRKRARK